MSIYIFIKLIRDPNNNMPLRERSLFMGGGGGGKWEGGILNTMSRVLISIITNSKKEDSENAISNDLETQNCSVPTMVVPRGSGAH